MRRGFKASCERLAESHRRAIGVRLDDALDPERLAEHLGVAVWRPEEVPGLAPESVRQLVEDDGDSWSAVTLQLRSSRLTIVNSAHAAVRQRSSVAHELAHLILGHRPTRVDVSDEGLLILSSFEGEEEQEADLLAATLLVPRNGLVRAYRRQRDEECLASHFGVSLQLLKWRLRTTGVAIQAKRASAYRRRRS